MAFTLDAIPPPTVYLTVNVVPLGAAPYVFVYKKLLGSILKSAVRSKYDKPEPTLVGSGIIVSSESELIPAPNCISILLSALKRVTNRFSVLVYFNIYGAEPLLAASSGS